MGLGLGLGLGFGFGLGLGLGLGLGFGFGLGLGLGLGGHLVEVGPLDAAVGGTVRRAARAWPARLRQVERRFVLDVVPG